MGLSILREAVWGIDHIGAVVMCVFLSALLYLGQNNVLTDPWLLVCCSFDAMEPMFCSATLKY